MRLATPFRPIQETMIIRDLTGLLLKPVEGKAQTVVLSAIILLQQAALPRQDQISPAGVEKVENQHYRSWSW